MAERTIAVKLRADISQFQSAMRSASSVVKENVADFQAGLKDNGRGLDELAAKSSKTGQVSSTALGKLGQSLKLQRQEWQTVGNAMLGVGTAATAIGVAVAKTGIQYNSLQQSSRAAMRTMLGSAEAATAQMDKLDAFARKSPFAKQTFISAQQQMLAFGIETKKVLPYLDALQNAVAAAGGTNNDISGLATIMAKISSSSKITATDLMQFGNYGVDAAQLIGDAMGKTAGQIRSEITAGSIDANAALDALAEGMSAKFDGAAANVKNTFSGALDRVSGAWRDLSASFMEPFVGKEGGGIFTSALNGLADFIRAIEGLPGPVKGAIGTIGALGGATALLGGGFLTLAPRILSTMEAVATLRSTFPLLDAAMGKTKGALAGLGKAAAVAAAVFAGAAAASFITDNFTKQGRAAKNAERGIEALTNRMTTASASASAFDRVLGDLAASGAYNTQVYSSLGEAIHGITNVGLMDKIPQMLGAADSGTGLGALQDRIAGIDSALAGMDFGQAISQFKQIADEAVQTGSTFDEVRKAFPQFAEAVAAFATEQGISTEAAWAQIQATGTLQGATTLLSAATSEATEASRKQAEAIKAVQAAQDAAASASASWIDAQLKAIEAENQLRETLSSGGQLVMDTATGRLNVAESNREIVTSLRASTDAWNAEMQQMQAAGVSQEELDARYREMVTTFDQAAIAAGWPVEKVAELRREFGMLSEKTSLVFNVAADTSIADADIDLLIAKVVEEKGVLVVDANTDPAAQKLMEALGLVADSEGRFIIDANTDPSAARLAAQLGEVNQSTGVLKIDANTRQAADKRRGIKVDIDNTTGTIRITGADHASSVAQGIVNRYNGRYIEMVIGARATGAAAVASIWANGGIVDYFSNGSEQHVAQIAPAGSWRVWAEPETGGEAYIPLHPNKRVRSTQILQNVADRFNLNLTPKTSHYAAGGITGSSSRAVPSMSWQMPSTLTVVDVDGKLVGRMRVEAGRVAKEWSE